jgi:UDP-2,3-diacylglucosamine hydrolase
MDSVFISDLHLNPNNSDLTDKFVNFINWMLLQPKCTLYILGDFLHAWPGDDGIDAWSENIANILNSCVKKGYPIYFMPGNRDFLLGNKFAKLAGWQVLTDPTCIELDNTKVLLAHGDKYCTNDRAHQWLRLLTRNVIFPKIFLRLPYKIRLLLVGGLRKISKQRQKISTQNMTIVAPAMLKHMQQFQVHTIIHGHIHKAGLTTHTDKAQNYKQYVLSDWDTTPLFLCYNKTTGFNFCKGNLK